MTLGTPLVRRAWPTRCRAATTPSCGRWPTSSSPGWSSPRTPPSRPRRRPWRTGRTVLGDGPRRAHGRRSLRRADGPRSTSAAPPWAPTPSPRSSSPPGPRAPPRVYQHPRHARRQPAADAPGWPFLADEPPVLLDWLPWSHTFGGNHDTIMVLANGGTLWIDDGRPAPALIGRTVAHLAQAQPTIYLNVPAGYAALLPHLERDDGAARAFFVAPPPRFLRRRRPAPAALGPAHRSSRSGTARRCR